MNARQKITISLYGVVSTLALLAVYALVVSAVSGTRFAAEQFAVYWYFLVSLALGFGIQMSLYAYMRQIMRSTSSTRAVAVTGTTSALSMISCCAHYLVTIMPALGVAGLAMFAARYQVPLFWVGIMFNLAGIVFMTRKIISCKKPTS